MEDFTKNSIDEYVDEEERNFIEQREMLIQDIDQTMKSILKNLGTFNVILENINDIGKDFENVTKLWEFFYTGLQQGQSQQIEEEGNERKQGNEDQIII
ncbi:Dad1p SCDLUD_003625 [Saccharomycodes ludwigii]|uniref:Dad1p n=1 Tax=Saccharomycodes ludwigii TaxID=36035 RepID=UPI001E825BA0|nr:hypothetical protein SCDLUD_003625 [Saccharomycodes ludwigii]KAH3900631.1 hypothetical protein SCDLUD_003625 [Saccharomycodes ludwigii]